MLKTIFVVDDNDSNLSLAKESLMDYYRILTLPSAAKMFSLLQNITPDLILLDIEMPEMDGFEALHLLKTNKAHAHIPVIFLTGRTETSIEVRGFQLGVVDFVTKPFSAPVLLNRIKTHLDIDEIIRERTTQLQNLQNSMVFVLSDMIESRDYDTGGHVERTTKYIDILTHALIEHGVYIDELKGLDVDLLTLSARLHDVGKIAIPDNILNKPGKLTYDEFEIMKTHAAEGERIIDRIVSRTEDIEFLHNAKLIAGYHHERWDGGGYPYGLKEAQIPLQGRIMAFVDVYDALVSERPYKKAFPKEEAVNIIMDGAGKQFDPYIADVFFDVRDQFHAVKLD